MNGYFSYKRLIVCYIFCITPFALLQGFLSLFHIMPMYFNGQGFYGLMGFLISLLCVPFFGVIMASLNWLALNFGQFLYNCILRLSKNHSDKPQKV
jgi:hypothetical protein